MASACCRIATFSGVTSPMMRTPSPGPGNGWRHTISSGRPSSSPTCAHLVLEQAAQRLDQLEVHVVGQAADVVVRLDLGRVLGARLDDVGVERALHEERASSMPPRRLLEHADEQLADGLALLLGIDDAVEPLEEAVGGRTWTSSMPWMAAERLDDLLALALAHQAGVDEDARELGPMALCTSAAATAESTPPDSPQMTCSPPTCARIGLDRRLDDRRHRPRRPAPAHVVEEVLEHLLAARRVHDLGVELHAVDAALGVLEARRPACRAVVAVTAKPGGRRRRSSRSGSSTRPARRAAVAEQQATRRRRRSCGAAVLAAPGLAPPRRRAAGRGAGRRSRCRGRARRGRRRAGSIDGAPSTCTDFRPAAEDDRRPACAPAISSAVIVCGTISL